MRKAELRFEILSSQDEIPFELLLLADPSLSMVKDYLAKGRCFVSYLGQELIGAMVLSEIQAGELEIKNIAIKETYQGQGFGRQLLTFAEKQGRAQNYKKLVIGTGNSSIGQLYLYQKAGFEIKYIKENFFLENYKEPIFEAGIQCKHMLVLEKNLE